MVDYTQAIEIMPDYPVAFQLRGTLKTDLGDYRGGMLDLNKAIKLYDNKALKEGTEKVLKYLTMSYLTRGVAKYHLGDNSGALQDYSKAIELNPSYAEAYINRGFLKVKI